MADTLNKEERSELMAKVRSSNTKPEVVVRKFLFSKGFRYKLNDKSLPGKPDIKLKKHNCLIFINGCFWHGHTSCNIYVMPKTNKKFWYGKIENNINRDKKRIRELRQLGWRVLIVWECSLKAKKRGKTLDNLLKKVLAK